MRKSFISIGALILFVVLALHSKLAHAALTYGDLVKGPNSDAVYYIGGDSKKHVFPDRKTFMTWYSDFSAVKSVTIAELDMYPSGKPVPFQAGTKLITHPNTARVYAVEYGGTLRFIPSEQCAISLYGSNWATLVQDVHEATFGSAYSIGTDIDCVHHPVGTLLQKKGSSTIYYVYMPQSGVAQGGTTQIGGYDQITIRPFSNDADFTAHGFNRNNIIMVDSLDQYTVGISIKQADEFDKPYFMPPQ